MGKKLISIMLTLCMLLTMAPTMAWADGGTVLDIADGSIMITDDGWTQGEATGTDLDVTITQRDATTATANTITVNSSTTITLAGVNMSAATPIKIAADTTLVLSGTNTLTSTSYAIDSSGKNLTIQGSDDDKLNITASGDRTKPALYCGNGNLTIDGGYIAINCTTGTNGASAIGGGHGSVAQPKTITISGGVLDFTSSRSGIEARNSGSSVIISGGTLKQVKFYDVTKITSITGGNVIGSNITAEEIGGRKRAEIYFADADENTLVTIKEGDADAWSAYCDESGMVTTYLADITTDSFTASVDGQDKTVTKISDGKFIVGGECTCNPTAFDWGDTATTAKVYSAAMTIPVTVDVSKCEMPFHKGEVSWAVTEGGDKAEKTDDGKLMLKPADADYTVVLTATLAGYTGAPLEKDTHTINVTTDSSIKSIDIGEGPVTVEAAAEAGKVVYKQNGSEVYTVDESEKVVITGEYICTDQNTNIIKITDCNPTIVLENTTTKMYGSSGSNKNNYLSNVLIEDTDLTDNTTYETNLLLSGKNEMIREINQASGASVSRDSCVIEVKGTTLTIDCVEGGNCSDVACPHTLSATADYTRAATIGARSAALGNAIVSFTLNINGGYIEAESANYGAAIGTGWVSGSHELLTGEYAINISDGYVKAVATDAGVAIGTGRRDAGGPAMDNMSVNITGGMVDAVSEAGTYNPSSPAVNVGSLTVSGTADVTVKGDINADSVALQDGAALDVQQKEGWTGAEGQGVSPGGNITNGWLSNDGNNNYTAIIGTTDVKVSGNASLTTEGGINGNLTTSDDAEVEINGSAPASSTAGSFLSLGGVSGDVTVGAGSSVTVAEEIGNTLTVEAGGTINGTEMSEDITVATADGKSLIVNADGSRYVSEGIDVNDDGTVTLPAGSTVTKDGVTIELLDGGTIALNGTITSNDAVTITDTDGNETTIIPAKNEEVTVNPDGTVDIPAGSEIETDDGTATIPEGAGTVTVPADKVDEVTADDDGNVTVPDGTTVTKDDETIELPNGGTIAPDGTIIDPTNPPAGDDEDKPSDGEDENKPSDDEDENKPSDGEDENKPSDDEDENKPSDDEDDDKPVKPTPKPPYGGYYPSYTPSVTPTMPSVDSNSLNDAALAVGDAIEDGTAEFTPANGYTKDEIVKLQKESKLRLSIEKKAGYDYDEKALIDALIAKSGGAVPGTSVLYFQITPVLMLDNGTVVAYVTNTEKPLSITLDLSDEITKAAKDGKQVAVARAHDGKAEFINGKLNAAKTKITFSSTDFSTFAVVALNKTTSAQTFDAGIGLYVGMSVLAATGGAAVVISKKRRAK